MAQATVYECDKRTWLKICLLFLLLTCVLVASTWFRVLLPKQFALFFAGLMLFFAVVYLATALLGLLLAYSRYEVREGRLFLVLPTGVKEIQIDHGQAPVVVPLVHGGRHLLHIYTRTKRKLLFDVTEHEQFNCHVKRLFAHDGDRKVSALQEYRGNRILAVGYLIDGALMILIAVFVFLLMPSIPLFNNISLFLLLTGFLIAILSTLTLRNTRVIRDRETLSAYNFLGRKTRVLKLRPDLHIASTKGFPYLACREGRFRIPLHVAFDKGLIYDAFAIAEGDYEFVDSDGSVRPQ